MNQMLIDFNAAQAARRNDPSTSKEAARNAAKWADSHAGRILQALKTHGPRSAAELEQLLGLSLVQVARRLPNLKDAGLARVCTLDDGADMVRNGCRVWEAI